jgi:hypothetical protein
VPDDRFRRLLLTAFIGIVFGGVVTPVVAALFLVVGTGGFRGFSIMMFGSLVLMAAVIAAPIGSACGLVVGVWLGVVGRSCRSRLSLTIHGAIAGFALSLFFFLSDWFLHRGSTSSGINVVSFNTVFPLAVGSCVGAAGAALFGRLLMKPWSPR